MTEKIQEIDSVVSTAFKMLSPELVSACIDNNYFVTAIKVDNGVPIKVDGVLRIPESEQYAIIDTKSPMTYDKAYFIARSKELWDMFQKIERWYKC